MVNGKWGGSVNYYDDDGPEPDWVITIVVLLIAFALLAAALVKSI